MFERVHGKTTVRATYIYWCQYQFKSRKIHVLKHSQSDIKMTQRLKFGLRSGSSIESRLGYLSITST